jgi:hypothetical protein
MDMYTDWGNLKVVSCVAWWTGRTRQLNGATGNGRIGGVHFQVKAHVGAAERPAWSAEVLPLNSPIGRWGKVQVI